MRSIGPAIIAKLVILLGATPLAAAEELPQFQSATGPFKSLSGYCREQVKNAAEFKLSVLGCPLARRTLHLAGRARTVTVLKFNENSHYPLDHFELAIETDRGWFTASPLICEGRGCQPDIVSATTLPVPGGEPLLSYTFSVLSQNPRDPTDDYEGRFLVLCAVGVRGEVGCLEQPLPLSIAGAVGRLRADVVVTGVRDGAVILKYTTQNQRFRKGEEYFRELVQKLAGEHALTLPD